MSTTTWPQGTASQGTEPPASKADTINNATLGLAETILGAVAPQLAPAVAVAAEEEPVIFHLFMALFHHLKGKKAGK